MIVKKSTFINCNIRKVVSTCGILIVLLALIYPKTKHSKRMAGSFEANEELSEICSRLWELDENRCEPGEDYELDLQGYVTSTRNMRRDWADCHLFSWLDQDKVFGKDTYQAFRALLDNYESETDKPEEVTEEEQAENWRLLDLVLATPVMQEAHQYLADRDRAPADPEDFKQLMYKIWFKLYRRLRDDEEFNSSGFEHVFVGETRGQNVIGFHNWIQFYLQEKKGNVDYRGYFRRGTSNEDSPRLVTLQFMWKKMTAKPIGSSFIGTSPEFEIALYTLLFLLGYCDKVGVLVKDYEVELVVHRHGRGIGSAYPISRCD